MSKHYHNNWKHNKNKDKNNDREQKSFENNNQDKQKFSSNLNYRKPSSNISDADLHHAEEQIRNFKSNHQLVCEKCGQVITELSSAINDRVSGNPIHFDCALEELKKSEKLEEGDTITYIGQGRFGIVNHPNPHDMKHFTIKKIIEWEDKEKKADWRTQMAELYSQVK